MHAPQSEGLAINHIPAKSRAGKGYWDHLCIPFIFFFGLWISDACVGRLWDRLFGPLHGFTIEVSSPLHGFTIASTLGLYELYFIQLIGLTIVWSLFGLAQRIWRPFFYSGFLRPLLFPVLNILGAVLYYQLWDLHPKDTYIYDWVGGDEWRSAWIMVTTVSAMFPVSQILIYYLLRRWHPSPRRPKQVEV